jgi:hypothetical protein
MDEDRNPQKQASDNFQREANDDESTHNAVATRKLELSRRAFVSTMMKPVCVCVCACACACVCVCVCVCVCFIYSHRLMLLT